MAQLEELLQQCTVQIIIPGQNGWGTGFFVAPGLILTCAHVVKALNVGATAQIRWQQQSDFATAELLQCESQLDLALLQFTPTNADLLCVYLDGALQTGQELYFFGYPDQDFDHGCPVTGSCEGFTGDVPPLIKFKQAQVRPGMSGSALLNRHTGKVCGMVKFTRDRSIDLGGGAIPTRVILQQFPQLRELQQECHQRDRRWSDLLPTATHPNKKLNAKAVEPYLRSLLADEKYQQQWGFYTLTDVISKLQEPKAKTVLDIGLMVQLMKPKPSDAARNPGQEMSEKTERLPVLDGIRKYAAEHVLLMGKPGSGKTTALLRLLIDETRQALTDSSAKIPVLVELRYLDAERPSVLERLEAFLRSHNLSIDEATLKTALAEGQLLLLIDGVNELPSEAARRAVASFRLDYPQTPMIFTTRDVAIGGDLSIEKKLEMQPLSEQQMRQFVQAYLPQQGEPMLRQLKGRLREVGQTPLLLWMLCEVFQGLKQLPSSLGLLFRWFTGEYDKLKQDVPVSDGLRHWQSELLQRLAFTMMQAEEPTELRVAISQQEAETVLAEFLHDKVDYPTQRAKEWLEDLLEHHLLQRTSQNQLEFHHQLLQEYYAAEALLKRLPHVSGEQLQRDYLNYLKWTEPIALMLALVKQEAQAVRVVKLALDVDWILGAKLAGAVKPELQLKTVEVIQNAEILPSLKSWVLGHTRSEFAIALPLMDLKHLNPRMRWLAVDSLRLIGSEKAIPELLKLLDEDPESSVCSLSAYALGEIGSKSAVLGLIKALKSQRCRIDVVNALKQIGSETVIQELLDVVEDPYYHYRSSLSEAIVQIISETTIPTVTPRLLKALEHPDSRVRLTVGQILNQIDSKTALPDLLRAIEHPDARIRWNGIKAFGGCSVEPTVTTLLEAYETQQNAYIRRSIVTALGQIGSEATIPGLVRALADPNASVRWSAVEALGHINSELVIPLLIQALRDQDAQVCRNAAAVLGKSGSTIAIDELHKLLKEPDSSKRWMAAESLGEIGSEVAVPELIKALGDLDSSVRRSAAWALGEISSEVAVPELIKALRNQDSFALEGVIEALGRISSDQAVPQLIKVLDDPDHRYSKRKVCLKTIEVLGKIGSEEAVPKLLEILQYPKTWAENPIKQPVSLWEIFHSEQLMLPKAIEALGQIGTEEAALGLVKFLELEMDKVDSNYFIDEFKATVKALGQIDSEVAIQGLLKASQHPHSVVRACAAIALGSSQSNLIAKQLPFLGQLLNKFSGWEELKAISGIQAKCQFYNYNTFQAAQFPDKPPPPPHLNLNEIW